MGALFALAAVEGSRALACLGIMNVQLVTTNLTGREAEDIAADFEFNEEGTKVPEFLRPPVSLLFGTPFCVC